MNSLACGGDKEEGGRRRRRSRACANEHIKIVVWNQDSPDVTFMIRRHSQLQKLMNAYCSRRGVDINTYRFIYDGRRVRGHQTPDQVGLEDGDQLDALRGMDGGGGGAVG